MLPGPPLPLNRNSMKFSPSTGLSSTICESNIPTNQLTFNEIPSQTTRIEKTNFKSRIRTGLTPRIERRGQSSEIQQFENEIPQTSIPFKDYKSHTGLLDQGIHIRKLTIKLKKETGDNLKKFMQRHKDNHNSIGSTDGVSEIQDPHTPFRDSFLIIQKSKLSIFEMQAKNKRECRTSLRKTEGKERVSCEYFNPQVKKNNPKKVEKVSVKDAIRDKE